ncbi:PX domain-containing protein EREL1 isoform X1 [Vigna umbellata]|uniref:PX domain-containing protein EREL1 isoform X1 n=1 Tax=Vigna umbellata TaxID=87088 RepID=UPI001F5E3BA3|nr:PX domain-containing protein EREL1 isoform X1 [Vigna umbellata]XP_047167874.1 PX domain-containing protein EREL1 isoform X1 [Vigna umbellata]
MQRRSPPKHRHDGTSPLPLGMDWSPAPRKWNGQDTVWPHNNRTGWSYCVTIPSWSFVPKSRNSDPVVFYRVQVGVQSPEGITRLHGVLRRFNDFLKLFADLKKEFPRKNIPPAPPKGLLRLKSRALLEERRCSLEEWITKLLSDIDVSRCAAVASFLELEAAARFSFQDASQQNSETDPDSNNTVYSVQSPLQSSLSLLAGSSSVASDYGSDTAYEPSDLGTPRVGRDDNSDVGTDDLTLDEDMTNPIEKLVKYGISNIDEGLFMGQTILEQLEGLPRHKANSRHVNYVTEKDKNNGNLYDSSLLGNNTMELFSEPGHSKVVGHVRKLSNESFGSEGSSLRGSDISNFGIPNSSGEGSHDLPGSASVSRDTDMMGHTKLKSTGDTQLVFPLDQRNKLNRILSTMQRRLGTAKTDMEDLIVRLNQEITAKDFLATKVKDLEVELETTKQKNKENLQQAILIERERFTQMQWDMEELRRKSMEMEMNLKSESGGNSYQNSTKESIVLQNDVLLQNLETTKEHLEVLSKQYGELEAKSKADLKVLVKEVKSLRNSQTKLKKELSESIKENSETEKLLLHERERRERAEAARRKLLEKCRFLFNQLQECNVSLPYECEDRRVMNSSSLSDAFNQLTTSDDQMDILLSEVENLDKEYGSAVSSVDKANGTKDGVIYDDEVGKIIADLFMDNVRLRKQTNRVTRHALKLDMTATDDTPSMETISSI